MPLIAEPDRSELLRLLELRDGAGADLRLRRHYAGRIDGHCIQNAIDEDDLRDLAKSEGFRVTWTRGMGRV